MYMYIEIDKLIFILRNDLGKDMNKFLSPPAIGKILE